MENNYEILAKQILIFTCTRINKLKYEQINSKQPLISINFILCFFDWGT